jgi:hypothetical protein
MPQYPQLNLTLKLMDSQTMCIMRTQTPMGYCLAGSFTSSSPDGMHSLSPPVVTCQLLHSCLGATAHTTPLRGSTQSAHKAPAQCQVL